MAGGRQAVTTGHVATVAGVVDECNDFPMCDWAEAAEMLGRFAITLSKHQNSITQHCKAAVPDAIRAA